MRRKCSVITCGKEIGPEDRSAYVVRVVPPREGHRFVCKEHYDEVKQGKRKPTRYWLFGKKDPTPEEIKAKKNKHKKKNRRHFKKRKAEKK